MATVIGDNFCQIVYSLEVERCDERLALRLAGIAGEVAAVVGNPLVHGWAYNGDRVVRIGQRSIPKAMSKIALDDAYLSVSADFENELGRLRFPVEAPFPTRTFPDSHKVDQTRFHLNGEILVSVPELEGGGAERLKLMVDTLLRGLAGVPELCVAQTAGHIPLVSRVALLHSNRGYSVSHVPMECLRGWGYGSVLGRRFMEPRRLVELAGGFRTETVSAEGADSLMVFAGDTPSVPNFDGMRALRSLWWNWVLPPKRGAQVWRAIGNWNLPEDNQILAPESFDHSMFSWKTVEAFLHAYDLER